MAAQRYRVAQWATGNVGLRSLRTIIEHPRYDLVALKVYSDAKAGRDAGDLCGIPRTGVIATQDIAEVIAAKPDCVVYMPDRTDIDELCKLLEAGINIATARFEFNGPDARHDEARRAVEAACQRGQASYYASGSTPGWFTEVMPLALSAMERRLDCITLTDFGDMASRNSPEMLFDILHFGADPASLDPDAPIGTAMSSPPSLGMTAAALGLPVDEFVCAREFGLARKREQIAAGTIEAGTIAAIRMEITGLRDGKPVIRRRSCWYVTRDIEPAWDLRDTGLHYKVEGDLPMEVMFTFPVSDEEYPKISPGMTAHPVVNAIPYVCAAPPGIRSTAEMPRMNGWFGA